MNQPPQSRIKKPADFIGRNRRAVRDTTTTTGRTSGVRMKEKQNKQSNEDTVEISKSYLEKLLKMTVTHQPRAVQPDHDVIITTATHIQPDHTKIPGLQHHPTSNKPYGNHDNRQLMVEEEYYPWGRPGGGAPIRSVSGALLTNFSTRGQAVQDMRNGIPRQPLDTHPHTTTSHKKSQFARGLGPHVDNFILSQREEQRRKELSHKEELAVQIAERQRMREIEKRKKEMEEMEVRDMRNGIPRQPLDTHPHTTTTSHQKSQFARGLGPPVDNFVLSQREEHQKSPSKSQFARGLGPPVDNFVLSQREEHQKSPSKSQFARGLGPHVDNFILSQREEQRRKELSHKEELAAQIAERQRMREIEKREKEMEEMEAEERVRRELEEMNRRNEREKERRQQKAAEDRALQATLQARIQEAEEAALHEKQLLTQQHKLHDIPHSIDQVVMLPRKQHEDLPSRIPFTTSYHHSQPFPTQTLSHHHHNNIRVSPPVPAVAKKIPDNDFTPSYCPPSPVVPALAKKLNLPSHKSQQHTITTPPTQPITPHHNILPTLPPAQQYTGSKFPTQLPQTVARQQTILSQLSILREGILSQRKSLDNRIQQLISNN